MLCIAAGRGSVAGLFSYIPTRPPLDDFPNVRLAATNSLSGVVCLPINHSKRDTVVDEVCMHISSDLSRCNGSRFQAGGAEAG